MSHTYEVKPEPGYSTVWVNGAYDLRQGDVLTFCGHRLVLEIVERDYGGIRVLEKQLFNHQGERILSGEAISHQLFPCQVERFTDRPVDWLGYTPVPIVYFNPRRRQFSFVEDDKPIKPIGKVIGHEVLYERGRLAQETITTRYDIGPDTEIDGAIDRMIGGSV